MNAFDRLYQWEAGAGAGKDAAGRQVYSGPGMMYMGPREFSATQAEHEKMKIAAAKADPQGMMIRELLEQAKNPNPGQASVRGLMGSYNAPDMRINMQDPRQAQG
jgi:hypothetical protein